MSFFYLYHSYSGKKINPNKSAFVCSTWVDEHHLLLVESMLDFQWQYLPFTYLGAPIHKRRLICELFDVLLAKIRARIFHWISKMLSMGGKIILLRHVLSYICYKCLNTILTGLRENA